MWLLVLFLSTTTIRFIVPSFLNKPDDVAVAMGLAVTLVWFLSIAGLFKTLNTNPKKDRNND